MKTLKSSLRAPFGAGSSFLLCLFAIGTGSMSAQSLTWDPNGNTSPDPSDGAGTWTTTASGTPAATWWNGTTHSVWDNTANAGTTAIFGAGTTTGLAGAINLGGATINVGGLQFDSIKLPVAAVTGPPAVPAGTELAYSFTNGTINLASNGNIDLRNNSSTSNTNEGRIRFDSIISGQNINIFNDQASNTSFGIININNVNNSWTGNLTLRGNTGSGLFVNAGGGGTLNSLSSGTVQNNATLALNGTGFTVGTLNIIGTGAASRGALRFDVTQTVSSNIVLTGNARIGAGNNTNAPVATLTGKISGGFALSIDSNSAASGTIIFKNNTNDFSTLRVIKGNAQIGEGGVGTAGTGRVTLDSTATSGVNVAVVSGTGNIAGGLTVTKGIVKPGDRGVGTTSAAFGAGLGTLNVGTDLTFNPATLQTVAQLSLAAPSATSDRINVTGNLALNGNGNISVLFDSTYTTPTLGNSWSLIGYTGTLDAGTFSTGTNLRNGGETAAVEGNLDLPDISASGYLWNIALGGGNLTVTIVPEASTIALAGLAFSAFALRRRR